MANIKVTVFGDSIAKGLEMKNGKPCSLETNAVEIVKNKLNLDIDNKSCFGQTIKRLYNKGIIDNFVKIIDNHINNYVVFCLGGNDCDFDWAEVNKKPQDMHNCKTNIDEFIKIYTELIEKLKSRSVKVIICALPIVSAEKFLNNYICSFADKNNILEFFKNDISNITRHQEMYNNALKDVAYQTNSVFLDIRKPFLQVKNLSDYYCDDGIHPNIKGQELIANEIIKIYQNNKFTL